MRLSNSPRRGLCDLFNRQEVLDFVEAIAESGQLSILAGAGTSIESGFPDWTMLVNRLLVKVADQQGLSPESSANFATWTVQREGLTAAAAVAEVALAHNFTTELHDALYEHQLTPPPGQTALGVAELADSFGHESCDISTTNYDLVLEKAMAGLGGVRPIVATGLTTRSPYRVLHLHCVMRPRGGIQGNLVLSERDYFLMQEDSAWQQRYFTDRLATSTCMFVGASLTDPNLLRYLYRSATVGEHWAIFVRQQDAGIYDEAADEVIKLREQTNEARWRVANIRDFLAGLHRGAVKSIRAF